MTGPHTPAEGPPPPPPPLLDWRDSADHWSYTQKPCRYCAGLTNLRDSKHKPAHKVCAEKALAEQAADALDAYRLDNH